MAETVATASPSKPERVGSIDAYRGLVMFLMLAEVLELCERAALWPGNAVWGALCHHQTHVEWVGCSLHDLIQPSFSFLVGTAMVFSLANREARGQSLGRLTLHALWRSLVLVFLGIFLRSLHSDRTNFTFEDTLTQIGLGYPLLFAIGLRPARDQWIALIVILLGYWVLFAMQPLPSADFDYATVGVPADWLAAHGLTDFAAHWQKNSNPAWACDGWFLNLFSRKDPFVANGGGYSTLSFVPTLATMILGLIAGGWLRDERRTKWRRVLLLLVVGMVGLAAGEALGRAGVCPVVKRIWTPGWVLFSGGWCFVLLAGFYAVIDVIGWKAWSYPLRVIGRNSIAAYLMHWLFEGFIKDNLARHLGPPLQAMFQSAPARALGDWMAERLGTDAFDRVVETVVPLGHAAAVLLVFWLILCWMDRRRIYLKI